MLNFDSVIVQFASDWRPEASGDLDFERLSHGRRKDQERWGGRDRIADGTGEYVLRGETAVENNDETARDDGGQDQVTADSDQLELFFRLGRQLSASCT